MKRACDESSRSASTTCSAAARECHGPKKTCAVESTASSLVPFARDGVPNMVPPQVLPNGPATIALVANHAPWPAARLAAIGALDRALFHQLLEDHGFVALAGCQDKGERLAAAFGTHVNFGAEAALAAAQRLSIGA